MWFPESHILRLHPISSDNECLVIVVRLILLFIHFYFVPSRDETALRRTANKEWRLKFRRRPVEFLSSADGNKVAGVRFEVNDLVEVKTRGQTETCKFMKVKLWKLYYGISLCIFYPRILEQLRKAHVSVHLFPQSPGTPCPTLCE